MLKVLRAITRLIFESVSTVVLAGFGVLGASVLLTALGIIPADLEGLSLIPRFLAGAIGLCFVVVSLLFFYNQASSEWGRDTPLFQWTVLSLKIGALLIFCSIFLWVGIRSYVTRQTAGDAAIDSATVLGLEHWKFDALFFGGIGLIFLLATLVHAAQRGRTLLGKRPAELQDQGEKKQ